jgi:predicted dehydrogenase
MTADAVRWGIVGTGEISHVITPDFALAGNARITAVASRSEKTADAFAVRHGIPKAFGSFESLLGDDDVDAVYLGTPHAVHHPMALAALNAGKHVLIEKPMALDRGQAEEVLDLAERRRLFAMEAMWSNFSPTMIAVLAAVRSGVIGEPRSVHATFGAPFPRGSGSRWRPDLHGSTLLDQGIYPVALAQAVLGKPRSMAVTGSVRSDGVDLTVRVSGEFAGGTYAQLAVSMIEFIEPSASIGGSTGWISIPQPFWASSTFTVHSGGFPAAIESADTKAAVIEGRGYTPMIREVSAAILRGETEHPLHPRSETLDVFETLDAVRADLLALDRTATR